jgi:hypothetical protein
MPETKVVLERLKRRASDGAGVSYCEMGMVKRALLVERVLMDGWNVKTDLF